MRINSRTTEGRVLSRIAARKGLHFTASEDASNTLLQDQHLQIDDPQTALDYLLERFPGGPGYPVDLDKKFITQQAICEIRHRNNGENVKFCNWLAEFLPAFTLPREGTGNEILDQYIIGYSPGSAEWDEPRRHFGVM